MNYPVLIRHYNTETQAVICSEECCSTLVFAQLQGVINYCRRHAHISSTLSSQVLKQGSLLLPCMLSRRHSAAFSTSFYTVLYLPHIQYARVHVYSMRFTICEVYSMKGYQHLQCVLKRYWSVLDVLQRSY